MDKFANLRWRHVKMSEIRENNRIYPNLSMELGRNFPGVDGDF